MMVKFLCEQGANVELVDNESRSVIHWITGRFFEIKKYKIDFNISVRASSSF